MWITGFWMGITEKLGGLTQTQFDQTYASQLHPSANLRIPHCCRYKDSALRISHRYRCVLVYSWQKFVSVRKSAKLTISTPWGFTIAKHEFSTELQKNCEESPRIWLPNMTREKWTQTRGGLLHMHNHPQINIQIPHGPQDIGMLIWKDHIHSATSHEQREPCAINLQRSVQFDLQKRKIKTRT